MAHRVAPQAEAERLPSAFHRGQPQREADGIRIVNPFTTERLE